MESVIICLAYGASSAANNVSSKYLVSSYKLPTFFLLFAQNLIGLMMCPLIQTKISIEVIVKTLPLALFFMGKIMFGLLGMKYVNLPMYVCITKMSTPVIYLIDFYQKKPSNIYSTIGIIFISLGGLVSGLSDAYGSLIGYFFVIMSMLMNTTQLIFSNKISKQGISPYQVFFSSVLVNTLIAFCLSSVSGDFSLNMEKINSHSLGGFGFAAGAVFSVLSNFTMTLCSAKVSPIATSVTGNIKDIFSVLIGSLIFSDVELTVPFVSGLFLSSIGALIYSINKLKANIKY